MKTLLSLIVLASALNAQAFSQVEDFTCQGLNKAQTKSVFVKTNSKTESLSYALVDKGQTPSIYVYTNLKITDVNPGGMEYTVDAEKDLRPVDGALVKANLTISLESFAPTRTHPATLKVETSTLRGPTGTVSYDVTCQN